MLRPATDADRDLVLRWRNHPDVRAVSLTQHEITPDEHRQWWDRTAAADDRAVYVYERGGLPAGVVTFFDIDRASRTAWWGYYLDNAGLTERGELLPAWIAIQREAVRLAFGPLDLDVLEAEVLDANEGVRHFNRRNGFEDVDEYDREVDGRVVRVHRVRATATGRDAR
jgi:UDP-4-amino-4,6-dideoxy-N-acetyl-beta-L-altrosamine N-acetyltransferase